MVDEQESRERRIILKRGIRSSPYLREYLMRRQQRGEKKFLGKEFWNAREWKWDGGCATRFRGRDDKSAGDN